MEANASVGREEWGICIYYIVSIMSIREMIRYSNIIYNIII